MERSIRRQLTTELAGLHRAYSLVRILLDAADIHNQELVSWSDRPLNAPRAILINVVIQEQPQDLSDVGVDRYQQGVIFLPAHYQTLLQPQLKFKISHSLDPLFSTADTADRIMGSESALLLITISKRSHKFTRAITQIVKGQKFASVLDIRYDSSVTSPYVTTARVRSEVEVSDAWGSVAVATTDLSAVRYVIVIQRPNDTSRMIDLHHNLVILHSSRRVDILPGRSGCLMFDSAWRLVRVHRGEPHLRGSKGLALFAVIAVPAGMLR